MNEKIGITCNWKEIFDQYKTHNIINCIQIFFSDKECNWHKLSNENLDQIKKFLNKNKIIPYVHASLNLSIATCPSFTRALLEIEYAEKINAKGIVFHCGTRKVPFEKWKKNLSLLRQHSKIPILLENSSIKSCYGSNIKELLEYVQFEKNLEICFDTMHWYATGQDMTKFKEICNNPKVTLLHINDIPKQIKKDGKIRSYTPGMEIDRHESIGKGLLSKQQLEIIQQTLKPKILETPDQLLWKKELRLITVKITKILELVIFLDGVPFKEAIDTAAEPMTISGNVISRLKKETVIRPSTKNVAHAGGSANTTQEIVIKSLKIGSREIRDQTAIIMPNQGREVLIPIELLSHYTIRPWQKTIEGYGETLQLTEREVHCLETNIVNRETNLNILKSLKALIPFKSTIHRPEIEISPEERVKGWMEGKSAYQIWEKIDLTNDKILQLAKEYQKTEDPQIYVDIQMLKKLVAILKNELRNRQKY